MRFRPVGKLEVVLYSEGAARPLGTLAWSSRERRAYFEYSPAFLASPLPVSPFRMPAATGLVAAPRDPFEGLHGLFNDSLPDGWGRLLLDRRLRKSGIDHHALTPLDRLAAVGKTGMGALAYIPGFEAGDRHDGEADLDWFVEQVDLVQQEMDIANLDALQGAQGGSAGARPKIMIGYNETEGSFVLDYGQDMPEGFERWMVKARGAADPVGIGAEEEAYALMARAAGVEMSQTRLFETKKGNRLFGTRRFDRTSSGRRHMHTASGLLNASHREASLGYGDLHKLTAVLTRDSSEVARMFRRMTYNVYARNRDDHAKNHAFLMGEDGRWVLSPAYDLTFSSGPGGEHSADVAGEGRNPGEQHLMSVAKAASIPDAQAKDIIAGVRDAVGRWTEFADQSGLPAARAKELDRLLTGRTPARTLRLPETSNAVEPSADATRRRTERRDRDEPGSGPKRL